MVLGLLLIEDQSYIMKIFVAAPLFSESERAFNSRIVKTLRKSGHNVWLAQEAPFIKKGTMKEKKKIFAGDIAALKSCEAVVAILDGIDIDSGVAFELGYAHCLGKPIVGLKTDYRTFSKIEQVNLMLEVPILKICSDVSEVVALLWKA
jgi:nucleoside 2-deoxyribosyltransferase